MAESQIVIITEKSKGPSGTSVKDGKSWAWQIYNVKGTDKDGNPLPHDQYSTFDDLPVDEPVEVTFEDNEKNGKVYHNLKQVKENPYATIRKLEADLKAAHERIAELEQGKLDLPEEKTKDEPAKPDTSDGKTDLSDIPF